MGYYTSYDMMVRNVTEQQAEEILQWIVSKNLYAFDNEYYAYGGDDEYEFATHDVMKWYDYDKDMIELSKLYPEATFRLSGDGEDRDDMWMCYYKNGKSELCPVSIVYPEPETIVWD